MDRLAAGLLGLSGAIDRHDGPVSQPEVNAWALQALTLSSHLLQRLPDRDDTALPSPDEQTQQRNLAGVLGPVQQAADNLVCADRTMTRLESSDAFLAESNHLAVELADDVGAHIEYARQRLAEAARTAGAHSRPLVLPGRTGAARPDSGPDPQPPERGLAEFMQKVADDLRRHSAQVPPGNGPLPGHGVLAAHAADLADITSALTAQLALHAAAAHPLPDQLALGVGDLADAAGDVATATAALAWADSSLYTLDRSDYTDHIAAKAHTTSTCTSEIAWQLGNVRDHLFNAVDALAQRAQALLASARTTAARTRASAPLPTAAALLGSAPSVCTAPTTTSVRR